MEVLTRIALLRAALAERRKAGARIAFVPTLGSLHAGHLALVDMAHAHADTVVMSIFVNPLQFGPNEDFARYPRDPIGDVAKAASRAVDIVFTPSLEELYPPDAPTWPVRVVPLVDPARWDAAARPGHFEGVLTVVAKLFHIVQPDIAVFGQKDIQQVTMVRAMVDALDMPVELLVAPTTRERDGLALSSRNAYLEPSDRQAAVALSRALAQINRAWAAGTHDTESLEARGRAVLAAVPGVAVEYLAVVEPERLEPVARAEAGTVVMVAARLGKTRLIDNIILGKDHL
ncbi:MAG TPA: pantoate--beta-alanine ligase [Gemmatimonadaceae bacterium]|nr:pantoate--beta-alanine ligase [Gemmatimonadaceae bacterium]